MYNFYCDKQFRSHKTVLLAMNSLANALAGAGVIPVEEARRIDKPVDTVADLKAFWNNKSISERLSVTKGFYDRIIEAIWILENGGSLEEVLDWSENNLTKGDAGKEFCSHLRQIKSGQLAVSDLRGKWQAVFNFKK